MTQPRSPRAVVVLSTYNGARHIAEQIQSIRDQSFHDWSLLVRDDGSSDETRAIVRDFASADPRISLVEDSFANHGPSGSFGKLLELAYARGADHVFLADQDDVWLPGKMEQQLSLIEVAELPSGGHDPLLVHSDLEVVDENLQTISRSFSDFQRTSYDASDPLRTLLIHNAISGCSMMVNRPLLELALPIPSDSAHDWWLAVCAAAAGRILRTSAPTVLYRQHAMNVVGAPPRHAFLRDLLRHPFTWTTTAFRNFNAGISQAMRLRDRLREKGFANEAVIGRIDRYCDAFADDTTITKRVRALRSSRARPQRAVSRVILYGLAAVFPRARARLGL